MLFCQNRLCPSAQKPHPQKQKMRHPGVHCVLQMTFWYVSHSISFLSFMPSWVLSRRRLHHSQKSIELVLCSPMKLRHRQTPYRNRNWLNLILCLQYAEAKTANIKAKGKALASESSDDILAKFQFSDLTNAFSHRPAWLSLENRLQIYTFFSILAPFKIRFFANIFKSVD